MNGIAYRTKIWAEGCVIYYIYIGGRKNFPCSTTAQQTLPYNFVPTLPVLRHAPDDVQILPVLRHAPDHPPLPVLRHAPDHVQVVNHLVQQCQNLELGGAILPQRLTQEFDGVRDLVGPRLGELANLGDHREGQRNFREEEVLNPPPQRTVLKEGVAEPRPHIHPRVGAPEGAGRIEVRPEGRGGYHFHRGSVFGRRRSRRTTTIPEEDGEGSSRQLSRRRSSSSGESGSLCYRWGLSVSSTMTCLDFGVI